MFILAAKVLLLFVYFFDHIVIVKSSVFWIRNQSRVFVVCQSLFCAVCHDMFISTAEFLLVVVPLFDTIVLETP